jgi:hypothetical protein
MTNYLSKAPGYPDVVTFDVADGSFSFYKKDQFEEYVDNLRNELVEDGLVESDEGLDVDDVLSMALGDEVFWDWMPGPVE